MAAVETASAAAAALLSVEQLMREMYGQCPPGGDPTLSPPLGSAELTPVDSPPATSSQPDGVERPNERKPGEAVYSSNIKQIKTLHEGIQRSRQAIELSVAAMSDAMGCLSRACGYFSQFMTASRERANGFSQETIDLGRKIEAVGADISTTILPTFTSRVSTEVVSRLRVFEEDLVACEKSVELRRKQSRNFDHAMSETASKLRELEKKGRPVSDSKAYGQKYQKWEETGKALEKVDYDAKESVARCLVRKDFVVAGVIVGFAEHVGDVLASLHYAMFDLLQYAEPSPTT